eukprot:GHVQ01023945.1.p1 GENE.GHVQ01023945.1~~GHVQ01023945.1.p1  ORF type:complete len:559 (+),score=113.23 GHVQ01023945.1:486-2162(+)
MSVPTSHLPPPTPTSLHSHSFLSAAVETNIPCHPATTLPNSPTTPQPFNNSFANRHDVAHHQANTHKQSSIAVFPHQPTSPEIVIVPYLHPSLHTLNYGSVPLIPTPPSLRCPPYLPVRADPKVASFHRYPPPVASASSETSAPATLLPTDPSPDADLGLFPPATTVGTKGGESSGGRGEGDGVGQKRRDFVFSGVVSGIMTKTCCAPFDRIRLLYQIQPMLPQQPLHKLHSISGGDLLGSATSRADLCRGGSAAADSAALAGGGVGAVNGCGGRVVDSHLKYPSLYGTVSAIVREEGVTALWRGNVANMCRAAFVYGIKFGTNDHIKQSLILRNNNISIHTQTPLPNTDRDTGSERKEQDRGELGNGGSRGGMNAGRRLGVGELLLAGAAAGAVQKAVCYPLDLLSVRIALGVNSVILANKTVSTSDGVRSGCGITAGIKATGVGAARAVPAHSSGGTAAFTASACTASASTPNNTISSHTTASHTSYTRTATTASDTTATHTTPRHREGGYSMYRTSLRIYHTEGLRGFYKGFGPTMCTGVPYVMLQMTFFELFTR